MANALSLPGGTGLISRDDLAKSLNNAAMSMPAGDNGGAQYLKMDKGNGDWLFGQEETVVEKDSLWAVNPVSLKHGYVAWDTFGGGAPVEEVMLPIARTLPAESSLPALPAGTRDKKNPDREVTLRYQKQRSVQLVCISGEDKGIVVEYKQSSVGAMKLFAKLTDELLAQVTKGNDIVAVVKLSFSTYKHNTYGRITNPEWTVQEWRPMDDTAEPGDEAEVEPEKEEATATRTRRAAPPKDAPVVDDTPEDDEEEARLAAEYAAEQAKAAGGDAAPRRRMRR